MPTPLWVAAGISALALAGGSAVAVVVIANSGPLSHGQSDQSTSTAPAIATLQPSTTFRATDTFDFNEIPAPDESNWTTVAGPEGRLTVKVPPGWVIESGRVGGALDYTGKSGEWVQVKKPLPTSNVEAGRTIPGWVSIVVSTQPFPVRIEASPATVLRKEQLISSRPVTDGVAKKIAVTQFTTHPQFPDYQGQLLFVSQDGRAGEFCLNAIAEVHFEATAEDIGIARAVVESAEALK